VKSFTLTFDPNPSTKYPHGYWYAHSEITDVDGDGPDPLSAVSAMTVEIEHQWEERE
jgi:hypothetical protein